MKFVIEIDLGNEAMQTPEDVAVAVKKVAHRLFQGEDSHRRKLTTSDIGPVMDANGNGVGIWMVKEV